MGAKVWQGKLWGGKCGRGGVKVGCRRGGVRMHNNVNAKPKGRCVCVCKRQVNSPEPARQKHITRTVVKEVRYNKTQCKEEGGKVGYIG